MISVTISNRTDRLVEALGADLAAHTPPPPQRAFHEATILVPSRVFAGHVTTELARHTGIVANLKFEFLEELVEELTRTALPGRRLLRRYDMVALILGALAEPTVPAAVTAYLERGTTAEDVRQRKTFELALHLSGLFADYLVSRQAWVERWLAGKSLFDKGAPRAPAALETEAWQRALFTSIFGSGGRRDRIARTSNVRWLSLHEAVSELAGAQVSVPGHLYLFGFEHLSPVHQALVETLGRRTQLHLYASVPFHCAPGTGEGLTAQLAALWGQPGHTAVESVTRLGGQRVSVREGPSRLPPVRILACAGIRREVEVIAGEIWELFEKHGRDEAGRAVRFREIAVVLADEGARDAYVTSIQAVFADVHRLPYKMLDAPSPTARRVFEGMRLLLDLPLAKLERRTLLPLLTHPLVRYKFPDADTEAWRRWSRNTAMFFGADHADNRGLFVTKDLYNADQAVKRLVLGAFLTGERSGDDRTFALGGMDYLPEEVSQDAISDAATFTTLLRSLVADARFAAVEQRSITEWTRLLSRQLALYFEGESEDEKKALGLCTRTITDLAQHDLDGRAVPYRVVHGLLARELEELASGRGPVLAPGVTVGTLASLRGLPFTTVFVCGLGEGRFPARNPDDPLDLRLHAPHRAVDIFRREQDRHRLLEVISATSGSVVLSYVARDPLTGTDLAPSSVVQELHRVLHPGHALEVHAGRSDCPLVTVHPLRRFDHRYHDPGGRDRLPSHDPHGQQEALALRLGQAFRDHPGNSSATLEGLRRLEPGVLGWLGLGPLPVRARKPGRDVIAITLSALRSFLECPLQGWAKRVLKVREEDDTDEQPASWDEPLITPRMECVMLLRETFVAALAAWDPAAVEPDFARAYFPRVERAELRGISPTGVFLEGEHQRNLETLRGWFCNVRALGLVDRRGLDARRFGKAEEHEQVGETGDPVCLDIDPPEGRDHLTPVTVELGGRTQLLTPDEGTSVVLVARGKAKPGDHLRSFLDAVFLAVASEAATRDHRGFIVPQSQAAPGEIEARAYSALTGVEARAYLTTLLQDLLFGNNAILFPHEAVFDFWQSKSGATLTSCIEKYRNDALRNPDFGGFSSTRGPLPNAVDCPLPDGEAEALRLLNRRFGLYVRLIGQGGER